MPNKNNKQKSKQHIVVIGAGVGGLAAALIAKSKGYDVSVYEQSDTYGGKMGTLNLSGAIFDTGPSLATDVLCIDNIYKICGLEPRNYWNYIKLPEITRYFWNNGQTYIMPSGFIKIEKSIARNFDVDIKSLHKYLKKMEYGYKNGVPHFVDKPVNIKSFTSAKAIATLSKISPLLLQDLHNRNKRYLSDNNLVQLFDRYGTYSGSNPYKAPALTGLTAGPEITDGIYYPIGGMRSIADGLYKAAKDTGVKFHFNSRVKSVISLAGKAQAILTDIPIKSDIVIYDGDSIRLNKLLGKSKEVVPKKQRSTSAFVFYWVVRGNHKQLGLHNILFSGDYYKEYKDISAGKPPVDPTVYINITSKVEPGLSPAGTENWFVMVNVSAGTEEKHMQAVKSSVLRRISTINITPDIVAEDYLSPKRLEEKTGAWQGAIYGQAANSLLPALKRPSNESSIKGLYLIGGTAHPGGGVPLAVRSATIVGRCL
jgi:phytoene desaturase